MQAVKLHSGLIVETEGERPADWGERNLCLSRARPY